MHNDHDRCPFYKEVCVGEEQLLTQTVPRIVRWCLCDFWPDKGSAKVHVIKPGFKCPVKKWKW